MNSFISNLTIFGSIASLISLFITLLVYYNLRNIRIRYLFTARIPDLIKKFKEHAKSISRLVKDFENSISLLEMELSSCQANLKNLKPKVARTTKNSIKELMKIIEDIHPITKQSKDEIWIIYSNLNALIQELDNLIKDKKWSS